MSLIVWILLGFVAFYTITASYRRYLLSRGLTAVLVAFNSSEKSLGFYELHLKAYIRVMLGVLAHCAVFAYVIFRLLYLHGVLSIETVMLFSVVVFMFAYDLVIHKTAMFVQERVA